MYTGTCAILIFCTKSKITYREFVTLFKDGSQGFWETQPCPILSSYFAHRGPLVGGCSTHQIAVGFPSTASQHPEPAGSTLGLCSGVAAPVSGHGPASSVWVPVHWLRRCRHLRLLWPSWHISGSRLLFTFSQSDTLLLWALFCSSTQTYTHTESRPFPPFPRLVQACQDPLYLLGHYVCSTPIQGHMRFGSQKTRPLSMFDF